MYTALVVDDEPLARRKLRDLILQVPWLNQIGEAADGDSAVALTERSAPDLVFLDVQMPGLSGTQVVRRLQDRDAAPGVIFTTAHDQYAVAAFELGAVDYLLKPFGTARFLQALERARPFIDARQGRAGLARAHAVMTRADGRLPLERIFVRTRGAIVPLENSRWEIRLAGGATVPVSRARASDIQRLVR